MATVIDSLIIELGLDPTNFTRGQKQAASDIIKTRDNLNQLAKDAETAGKRTAQFFAQMREQVVLFFAAFTAGKGMKEFLSDVVVTDANMGRLARTMDMSVETLSLWGGAIEMAGGSADSLTHSMMNLSQDFANFALTGQSQVIPWLRGFGIQVTDAHNRALGMDQVLRNITKAMREQSGPRAEALGRGLGLDQATINAIRFNNVSLERLIELRRRLGVVTQEDVNWQQKLQEGLVSIRIASESLGRTLVTWLSPSLVKITDSLVNLAVWAQSHGEVVKTLFVGLSVATGLLTARLVLMGASILGLSPAVAILSALGAALYYLWNLGNKPDNSKKQLEGWRELTKEARKQKVNDFFNPAREGMLRAKEELLGLVANVKKAWVDLGNTISDMWKRTADYIKNLGSTILQSFQQAFNPAIDWLKTQLNYIWEKLGRGKLFEDVGGSGVGVGDGVTGGAGAGGESRNRPVGGPRGVRPSGSGAGVRGWWTQERQQHAYDVLTKEGKLSDMGAKGLISRWMNVESSGGPSSKNPISGAFGIGQWLGNRLPPIAGNTNFDDQLRYTIKELNNKENVAGVLLRRARTAEEGAKGATSFERAEGYSGATHTDLFTGRTLGGMRGMNYTNGSSSGNPYGGIDGAQNAIRGLNSTSSINNNSRVQNNNTQTSVNVGAVHVHTPATDANSIASDIKPALEKTLVPHQADYGQW